MTEDVRAVARSYFPDKMSPAHDWFHVERVEANAERLAESVDGVGDEVLQFGVLLHDIGRAREDAGEIDDHAAWGAVEARGILEERGVAGETIDAVAHCIRAHRYSNDVEPETVEAEVLSDADNLDALGAVGVARCFSYGGEHGSPMYDPDLPPEADDTPAGATQFNHIEKKLLDLPERMYTERGWELAAERASFLRAFTERFEKEAVGER